MKDLQGKAKRKKLYPIFYKDKWWYKKDCSDVFTAVYHEKYQWDNLLGLPPIYVGDGMSVYPDGTMEEF